MCWKQEWAAAIGNLQYAIGHIEKAQHKLERRREKNIETMLKHRDRWTVKTVAQLAIKNTIAIEQCKQSIAYLKKEQAFIFAMIQTFGITNRGKSKRLVRNMVGYKGPLPRYKP